MNTLSIRLAGAIGFTGDGVRRLIGDRRLRDIGNSLEAGVRAGTCKPQRESKEMGKG